ncbi:Rieske 2Fe-2S domain-containing protein [Tolypothrix bouteillei VB521301]|uniref:Rieske 2Fe-2S domain-containing protein n=2 Tax=Nostocales TaxID=1161 RepID=A0A0C1RHN1_9CYAN|nr:Rieske 2Fe-2S domain-containing protein [Tolypothrix bouteillei VB521301]
MKWVKVVSYDDIWEGEMLDVEVDGQDILLVHCLGGHLQAYQSRCPHQKIPLSEGNFDGKEIECRAHLWKFDAASGKGINPENCQLLAYAIKVESNEIYIGIPQGENTEKTFFKV